MEYAFRIMTEAQNGTTEPRTYAGVELELQREKIALERERLAHERERLELERERLRSETERYTRHRRVIVTPTVAVLTGVIFCLVGIGVGHVLARRNRIELDARQVDGKLFLKSQQGDAEQEAVAYLLLVK
jgi:hypothetical protein